VQWGGRLLYADGQFATPDHKAHFAAVSPRGRTRSEGTFYVSTRRGKQFNSMVQHDVDPLTGAARDAVLMSEADAEALGVTEGTVIRLRSEYGCYDGRVCRAPVRPGNLEVYWPEGNALIGPAVDPDSLEPDYNAVASVEILTSPGSRRSTPEGC